MEAQGSPVSSHTAETDALSATTSFLTKYPARMLESVLSIEERLGRKLDQTPTRRDPEYGDPSPGSPAKFSYLGSCDYLDILQYTDTANVKHYNHEEGTLRDIGLSAWFDRVEGQDRRGSCEQDGESNPTQRVFSGGLRLLYGVCDFDEATSCPIFPLPESAFKILEEKLCLPEHFIPMLTGSGARAFTTSCPPRAEGNGFCPSTCFVFRFGIYRPNYYQLALSYDPVRQLTYGILLAKTKDHEFPYVLTTLKKKHSLCTHPLLLPNLVITLTINSSAERIRVSDWRLNELEETMGQHEYVNRPMGDPLAIDFIATTRTLNTTTRLLGVERMRLGATILALELIARETKALGMNSTGSDQTRNNGGNQAISDWAAYHMNVCQNLVLRTEYAEKRVHSQIAVVYQFMAQKDSKVNISLAETSATIAQESKKDSSSMKAIAVLTMSFLPGTFLAAIFAMPLFEWDGDGAPVIKNGFRYYWAIAIPLTALVLGIWVLSMLLPWRNWLKKMRGRDRVDDVEAVAGKGIKEL